MAITVTKSDADIDRAVTQELEWDPRVDSQAIAISVKHGVVTLAGFVDSYAKKLAARDAAHAVSGVLAVADQIQVKPVSTLESDDEIAQAIRSSSSWDVYVPDQRIKSTRTDATAVRNAIDGAPSRRAQREARAINIKVNGSTLRLSGIAQSKAEKNAIERMALNTAGVTKVENAIVINPDA